MEAILVFFFLWLLFSLYLIVSCFRKMRHARISDGWAYCQGIVEISRVREEVNREKYGSPVHYFPVVNYAYRVGGKSYKNDKISFSLKEKYRSLEKAERIIQKYAQGSAVTVSYDPNDPATSILDRSVPRDGLIWGIVLAVLWMVGVISVVSMLPQ